MEKMETLTTCKIWNLEQIDTKFVRIDYVDEMNVCSKFGVTGSGVNKASTIKTKARPRPSHQGQGQGQNRRNKAYNADITLTVCNFLPSLNDLI